MTLTTLVVKVIDTRLDLGISHQSSKIQTGAAIRQTLVVGSILTGLATFEK